ncbi:Threonylcarbamoyl-AMP synthase [Escovopsis weberi]|uniref:Threonylcarbamoyl-AMP synthase n=1 Tax=Escovopsis weberi TaxID=150374 RepID=A0A0M8MY54_ESCWE|nr:Threonylcarbamoyl-AMP synthase [Escovopsis weberi]
MHTNILRVLPPGEARLGEFVQRSKGGRQDKSESGIGSHRRVDEWRVLPEARDAVEVLRQAAEYLKSRDTPVAFPTETVYGLGADATRSASVRGIYSAKGRPSDNPLIVHVADLGMLRNLLRRRDDVEDADGVKDAEDSRSGRDVVEDGGDVIPERYRVLIERFWPGPLTILLPNPRPSRLAPEVTAGLGTFGARMPSSPLALSLIKLAGVPLAAPSANASTKPSPTTAQHVMDDLDGRIELILDGGPCRVGVESTVVDGLCDPPVVLRPGGVGIDELRACPGWERVTLAYKDHSEEGAKAAPRAPGMKYKHYSPKARVVLYEASCAAGLGGVSPADLDAEPVGVQNGSPSGIRRIGAIRTQRWARGAGLGCGALASLSRTQNGGTAQAPAPAPAPEAYEVYAGDLKDPRTGETTGRLFDIDLGRDIRGIAQGLFSALRELDRLGVDVIFVDGIRGDLDIAAAVMNRLRKAASEIRA